jgi:transcriptional regulator with XRE-family HTH domain/tetratricopeptide (TPR) repeat protein
MAAGGRGGRLFGDLVRTRRRQLGLTQEDLAAKAGLGVRTLRNIEAGRILRPRPDTLRALADALGLDSAEREAFYLSTADRGPQDPGRPTPAQLPPDVPGFAGRREHLARLGGLLSGTGSPPTAVVISAIAGTAGVGKTALAVHWAHRIRHRFPDGQLYINLRGFDPPGSAVRPAEAVRVFLDALGVAPDRVPYDPDARVNLFRSLLARRRVLVVLDNARDSDQVRPLLPGAAGCLVLVTSRNDLSGLVAADGARPLALDVLSDVEARELLAARLGREAVAAEAAAVDAIVAACARLPLALAIVAARVQWAGFRLADMAAELAAVGRRLDVLATGDGATDLRAVLSWSYGALTPAAARTFRLLGLHPGPDISAAAAASLAGEPPATARRVLTELVRANLLREGVPDRYSFHDLLREYAAGLAEHTDAEAERRAALTRLLDHYAHTAHAANWLVSTRREPMRLPLGPVAAGTTVDDVADAKRWLTVEHPNLRAVQRLAAESGFDAYAWQLAWTLTDFLDLRGDWPELGTVWRTALDAASRLGHRRAAAYAHHALANVGKCIGRYDECDHHAERAIALYSEVDDKPGQAATHRVMAAVYWRQGDPHRALDRAEQTLALYRAAGHERGTANALNSVAWYQIELRLHVEALANGEQALVLLERLGDRYGQAATLDTTGYAHHHLGAHERAIECFDRAIELFRGVGARHGEASALHHLGDAHRAVGDLDAARAAWTASLQIFTEIDDSDAAVVRTKLEDAASID